MPTLADEFKTLRKESYKDHMEFFEIVETLDPESIVRVNKAKNAEIVFSDGSTYIIGVES